MIGGEGGGGLLLTSQFGLPPNNCSHKFNFISTLVYAWVAFPKKNENLKNA